MTYAQLRTAIGLLNAKPCPKHGVESLAICEFCMDILPEIICEACHGSLVCYCEAHD